MNDTFLGNLAQSLKQVPKLEKLDLTFYYRQQITTQGIMTFSSSLPLDLKFLNIDLGFCDEVDEKGFQSLFCSIGKIMSLEDLSLKLSPKKGLGNNEMLDLNLCLSGLKHLNSLFIEFKAFMDIELGFLDGNEEIHNLVFDEFLCVLASKPALKKFVFNFPSWEADVKDAKRLERLGDVLSNLKRMETLGLNLYGSWLTGAKVEYFADKLGSFEKLQTLSLNFSSTGNYQVKLLERFMKSLEKLNDLQEVRLCFQNCFYKNREEIVKILPSSKSIKYNLSVSYENYRF